MARQCCILSALLAAFLFAGLTRADESHALPLWHIEGEQNDVYLLGSIHLLREQDHPIPDAIFDVYEEAEMLYMELDMDDMDPFEGQALTNELGLIRDGRTLRDLMGPDLFAQAATLAEAAQIPLGLLEKSEPWFAAMNVEIMLLMRIGFNPIFGIENQLMERARADGKEILGFETMRQQLEFLDGLSQEAQQEMLIQALSEGSEMQDMMDSMIEAWRNGDTVFMEENLLADMENYPELNRIIVVDRNMAWTDTIEALLDESLDYLVIVGALHLIGDEGVPSLLESRGHSVSQMRQTMH
jgi:uncharacterized protein YbaP (TraB family)